MSDLTKTSGAEDALFQGTDVAKTNVNAPRPFLSVEAEQSMNIRFTSSLTPDDENAIAPALLNAFSRILDLLPIAYMLRIETSDAKVFEQISSNRELIPSKQPPTSVGGRRYQPDIPSVSHR